MSVLKTISLIAALSACHAIPSAALGQEGPMSLQFLAFPKQLKPAPVELLIAEGKTIRVETPGHELSKAYRVPMLEAVSVGETVVDEEGEESFKAYGHARSVSPQQIILLIRKGPHNSDGFHVIPIDSRLPNFGGASFLFLNASSLRFAATIADTKFTLDAGEHRIIKPVPNHPPNNCQVTLFFQRPESEEWKKFYDTRWPANEATRSLVFFYEVPETGRVGIAPVLEVIRRDVDENPR